jgi:hypothetical protein
VSRGSSVCRRGPLSPPAIVDRESDGPRSAAIQTRTTGCSPRWPRSQIASLRRVDSRPARPRQVARGRSGCPPRTSHRGPARAAPADELGTAGEGGVLLAQDNPIDAANLALASAAKAATVGAHLEAARSQAFAGRALLSAGEREHAAAELQAAAAQFESCDAMRGRDAVERELRRLGDASTAAGSRATRASARSAGARAGDRRAGHRTQDQPRDRRRALSQRANDRNALRNTFAKLGVSSRRAVAHALEVTRAHD